MNEMDFIEKEELFIKIKKDIVSYMKEKYVNDLSSIDFVQFIAYLYATTLVSLTKDEKTAFIIKDVLNALIDKTIINWYSQKGNE